MAATKIQMTKNYRMFTRNPDNRAIDARKHKKLRESMEKYGFLRCFPIVVRRDRDRLIFKDGQHRLMLAETLGLPVWWVEEDVDFDIAEINTTAKVWTPRDYALKFASNGHTAYAEGLEFAEAHKLSIGTAFAMLAGTTSFGNCRESFESGTFKVRDRQWAEAVAGIYGPHVAMEPKLRHAQFVGAYMAVCRAPGFDPKRLLSGARNCREKLVAYSTRDGYLDMLEYLYNWKRSNLVGLKVQAQMAMRERNVSADKKAGKPAPKPAGRKLPPGESRTAPA